MTIQDTRMMARAVEQRWPITPEYRQAIIKRLMRIAIDPDSSAREATSAAKAVMAAEAQNIADEQHDDHLRMDAGRNRILTLLGSGATGTDRIEVDAGGAGVPRISDQQSSSKPATRKNKGRKPQ